jgi:hypothetical protein
VTPVTALKKSGRPKYSGYAADLAPGRRGVGTRFRVAAMRAKMAERQEKAMTVSVIRPSFGDTSSAEA